MNPFENATAADFQRTSARDERQTPAPPFDEWVHQHLETARIAYEASEGGIDPWVVLVKPQGGSYFRRLFTPESDETNRDFFARIKREATEMQASQVFIAMISRSTYSDGGAVPTARDVANREEEFAPLFEESILWYAESPLATRYGAIPVHLGRAGEVLENADDEHDGASPLFTAILR